MSKETLPKYIKYIKKDFRINNCKTIRIGSYDDFRNIEDETRKDPNEGVAPGYHIDHMQENDFRGEEKIIPGIIEFKDVGPDAIIDIRDITYEGHLGLPNRYFFSCSEPPMIPQLRDEFNCDSFYEIGTPLQFGKLLMNSLVKKLNEKGLLEKCKGVAAWSKIEYTNDERLYNYDAKDKKQICENDALYYRKKTRFKCQYEWRISFLFWNDLGFIPAPTKDILIDVNDKIKKCCNFPKI